MSQPVAQKGHSGLLLTIDNEPVPIEDVDWLAVASCGCVSGVTTSNRYVGDKRDGFITNAEDACRAFNESVIEAKRDEEDGFTYRPIKHSDFRAEVGDMGCSHFPKWGVPKAVVPDGYEWAATGAGRGRQSHTSHLLPSEHVNHYGDLAGGAWKTPVGAKALCGATSRLNSWSDLTFFIGVTCRKCEKAAGYETTSGDGS